MIILILHERERESKSYIKEIFFVRAMLTSKYLF
jgi:hypothetical protein